MLKVGAAWCAGYAIAFIYNWKLTLVMTASVPLIALAAIMQVEHACLPSTREVSASLPPGSLSI